MGKGGVVLVMRYEWDLHDDSLGLFQTTHRTPQDSCLRTLNIQLEDRHFRIGFHQTVIAHSLHLGAPDNIPRIPLELLPYIVARLQERRSCGMSQLEEIGRAILSTQSSIDHLSSGEFPDCILQLVY